MAASLAAVLAVVWYGLGVDESTRFVSFVRHRRLRRPSPLAGLGVIGWLRGALPAPPGRHADRLGRWPPSPSRSPRAASAYWIRVFASIGVFAAAAIGLNVVVGLAGLLDLGYIAFFGVGAYVGALLAGAGLTHHATCILPFVRRRSSSAPAAAAVFGVIIGAPTLRLRGDYLAIVTLGFGEIFRIVANNLDGLTRGPNGISGIPDLAARQLQLRRSRTGASASRCPASPTTTSSSWPCWPAVILVFTRLNDSRIGRAWVAIREDEVAAAAMGVNTVRLKLLAFAIGAFLAGAAGTVNAHFGHAGVARLLHVPRVDPAAGRRRAGRHGHGARRLLGSTALFVIPEKLRAFQDKRLLLFGVALVLMMRFRPEGIVAQPAPAARVPRRRRAAPDALVRPHRAAVARERPATVPS